MKIWGIVRNALALITARYADGELKPPNLTEQGNIAVETILTSAGGLVPAVAVVDDSAVVAGQTVALGISENYVYSGVSATWIRAQALLDNSDGQAPLAVGTQGVIARLQGWNGATFDRVRSRGNNADGQAVDTSGRLSTNSTTLLFNGVTLDRQRGNVEGVAIPSAVYNGGPIVSADIVAHNARSIMAFFDVTAVPGVVSVTAKIQVKDPASGKYFDLPGGSSSSGLQPVTASIVAIGNQLFQSGNVGNGFTSSSIARTIRFVVTHSAAGNFTYSVGYSLMV